MKQILDFKQDFQNELCTVEYVRYVVCLVV